MPSRYVDVALQSLDRNEDRALRDVWDDLRQKWRRLADAVNGKAFSLATAYEEIATVGSVLIRHVVPADRNLVVMTLSATARVAGAGGANGISLSLTGGSSTKSVDVLPIAATSTDLDQSSLLNYEVPGGKTLVVSVAGDDHAVPPEEVRYIFGIRIL